MDTTYDPGLATSGSALLPSNPVPVTTNPVSILSSEAGLQAKQQADQKLTALSPTPAVPINPTADQLAARNAAASATSLPNGTATQTKTTAAADGSGQTALTLINPATEQTVTFNDAAINKDRIDAYMKSGYQVAEGSGNLPDWLTPTGVSDTSNDPTAKAQAEADQYAADLKTLRDGLTKYTVSDADLQQQIAGITSLWDAREADMQKVNASRVGSINTLGVRLGSQFSGGSGGVFGGIVSEEERQGIVRIGELEGQKQAAIAAAKTAALTQNWQVYAKQVDLAEKAYTDKVAEVKNLNDAAIAQNKLIADQIQQQQKTQYDQVTKPINDVLTSAVKNNAPKAVIDAINNAKTPAEAIQVAGSYLQDVPTTGIVGEYLFYKKQAEAAGQTAVDFNTYQNIDANRKARVAAAGASGLSPSALSKVTTIADQFKSEQTVQQYQTIAQGLSAFKSLGDSPADDIQRIYTFAKTMDPNSAVREGEYNTVQQYAQAYLPTLGIKVARLVDNRGFLTQQARDMMEASLDKKFAPVASSYNQIRSSYANRIDKVTGGADGTDYLTDYSQPTTADQLIKDEKKAQDQVVAYLQAHPDKKANVQAAMSAVNPDTGQPLTAVEFVQAFPEYAQTADQASTQSRGMLMGVPF